MWGSDFYPEKINMEENPILARPLTLCFECRRVWVSVSDHFCLNHLEWQPWRLTEWNGGKPLSRYLLSVGESGWVAATTVGLGRGGWDGSGLIVVTSSTPKDKGRIFSGKKHALVVLIISDETYQVMGDQLFCRWIRLKEHLLFYLNRL